MWRHYLYGEQFEVHSDHRSLQYLFTQSDLNNRQRHWMEYIKDYDFPIKNHPGKANAVAVALSRKAALVSFLAAEGVKDSQRSDPDLVKVIEQIDQRPEFRLIGGVLYYQDRLCVPDVRELKDEILVDAHHSRYSIHPSSTKMYQNLRSYYWWNNMKKETVGYVSRCLTC
ncbi:hypothetical protein AAC387_Pa07g2106 [Persea americana]